GEAARSPLRLHIGRGRSHEAGVPGRRVNAQYHMPGTSGRRSPPPPRRCTALLRATRGAPEAIAASLRSCFQFGEEITDAPHGVDLHGAARIRQPAPKVVDVDGNGI